jgi:hypothetical protein
MKIIHDVNRITRTAFCQGYKKVPCSGKAEKDEALRFAMEKV